MLLVELERCANRSSYIRAGITRKGLQLCSWWKGAPIDRAVFAQVLLLLLQERVTSYYALGGKVRQ
jgi:hypothetical protein